MTALSNLWDTILYGFSWVMIVVFLICCGIFMYALVLTMWDFIKRRFL